MGKRLACPIQNYADAFVVMPDEWLGRHLVRRTAAVTAAAAWGDGQLTNAAIALAVVDEFGGVTGAPSADPKDWDLTATPLPVLRWLDDVVYAAFREAFVIPKG